MTHSGSRLLAALLAAILLLALLPVFGAASPAGVRGSDIILPPDEFGDPDPLDGYTDVKASAWYYSAVKYMVEKGYMGSTSTKVKNFEPGKTLTRAEFVQVLYKIKGSKVSCANPFADVKADKWYYDAVLWAYKNGITSGTTASTFSPNEPVTREQVAQFLYNAYGVGTAASDRISAFPDGSKVSGWARTAMNWAIQKGIISGEKHADGSVTLNPKQTATRAELASIIFRMLAK